METLKFEYDATGPSVRVVVPAMQDGVVLMGATPPESTMSILEFEAEFPDLYIHLYALINAEPRYREKATRPAKDPNALQAQANANAREAERLRIANEKTAQEKLEAEQATARAAAEIAAIEEAKEKAAAELAAITAQVDSKRAEMLATVEAAISEEVKVSE